MGGTTYDSHSSRSREMEYKSMSREQIFKAREIHASLNPFGLKVRECRDSDVHPNTIAVIMGLDVTGSMGRIPEDLIKNHFSNMMETFIAHGITDVAICFCGIGDHYSDEAPLQVGQFESGDVELTNNLTNIWLEGNGGGQKMESYLLPWLFAARHTSIDSFIKRHKKGYLFTIGDEWNHPCVESVALKKILGYKESQDEMATELLKEAQEQWNVYHIHCSDGSYGVEISDRWKRLLGENLFICHSSKVVDKIVETIVIAEGSNEEQTVLINTPIISVLDDYSVTPSFLKYDTHS